MRYVLGLDGGGSKTVCLAADERGRLLSCGRGGSINTNYVSLQEAVRSFHDAIQSSLECARLSGEEIDLLCMSAPISPDAVEMATRDLGLGPILRAAEGETTRWAAQYSVDGHVGVTVDAGTGAMARGWSKDGREAGASGWGATLGDEGSSFWIGIEAMRAILRAFDGRTKPTMLTEPVLAHFGFEDMLDMVFRVDQALVRDWEGDRQIRVAPDSGDEKASASGGLFFREESVPRKALRRHEIAGLCPIVSKVALWGDWKAKEIFRQAGQELGEAAVAVIRRLAMEEEDFVVVPFGGVFRAGELVLGSFKNTIEATAPLARISEPEFEPVVGAVLMALEKIGVNLERPVISNLKSSAENLGYRDI